MIQKLDAVDFVDESRQATGVLVSFGINAYFMDPKPKTVFFVIMDPFYLSREDESKLKAYAERKDFLVL